METVIPTNVLVRKYDAVFGKKLPVYDGYIDQLEKYPEVEITRIYSCGDCNDTRYIFDEEAGEKPCVCNFE